MVPCFGPLFRPAACFISFYVQLFFDLFFFTFTTVLPFVHEGEWGWGRVCVCVWLWLLVFFLVFFFFERRSQRTFAVW